MQADRRYEVHVGSDMVSVRRRGEFEFRTAVILGRSRLPDGRERLWLDRLVHGGGPLTLNDSWAAEGAVSTILTQQDGALAQ